MNDTDRAQRVLDATKGYKLRYAYKRDRQKIIAVALREAIQCVLPDEIWWSSYCMETRDATYCR
jgi:hypothetical protein